ncbi:penicillin-binding protein 1C [Elusimicrobiota bacterium]
MKLQIKKITLYCIVGAFALYAGAKLIIPKPVIKEGISLSRAIYDRNGQLLRLTLSDDEKYRLWLPLHEYPESIIKSALIKEDKYFFLHPGVNPVSLVRAVINTYLKDNQMGASTITMQLARLRYGIKTRTIPGKLLQILKAFQLELKYSKKDILEAYLNLTPYGSNIEGMATASLIYFNKSVLELNLLETMTLVVVPQKPSRIIFNDNGKIGLDEDLVRVRNMLYGEWITKYPDKLEDKAILESPLHIQGPRQLPFEAPHFTDAIIQEDIMETSQIYTTLNTALQEILERKIKNYIETQKIKGINNATAVLINYNSMEVVAAVGSAEYFNPFIQGQVNGYKAKRSPGSTLKPFVYALGFDKGIIHPQSMLKDAPVSYGGFNPENFDGDFKGPITMRDALIHSRNVPAVNVAAKLDKDQFYDFLKSADIELPFSPAYYGMAPVLGGIEVTMEDLLKLYAMLANGGLHRNIKSRSDIYDNNEKQLLSKEACYLILDILKEANPPDQSYSKSWLQNPLPVHWKTGTSYAYRDAWTVGIFGQYVLAVWVGNFQGDGNPAFIGIKAAAPLFFSIVDGLRPYSNVRRVGPFNNVNIKKVDVCSISGDMPNPHCPHKIKTLYIPGISPIKKCDIHRLVLVSKRTGKIVSMDSIEEAKAEVYEFWPSDLLKIFKQAGIPRYLPPIDIEVNNENTYISLYGNPPEIASPISEVVYNIRLNNINEENIPFMAEADADVQDIFWFVDSEYIAKSRKGETVFWKPKLGNYIVRAVDEKGRSDVCSIKVSLVE